MNTTHLADVVQSILEIACTCLDDTPNGAPEECFISHGEPPADCCDYLSIWVENIRPIQGFENAQYISGVKLPGRCGDIGQVADLVIRLVRPCYPILKDDARAPFPPPEDIDAAAQSLLIDAYTLRCCVMTAHSDGILLPDDTNCLEIAWGDMLPLAPKGGCAGWTWRITVELERCCW